MVGAQAEVSAAEATLTRTYAAADEMIYRDARDKARPAPAPARARTWPAHPHARAHESTRAKSPCEPIRARSRAARPPRARAVAHALRRYGPTRAHAHACAHGAVGSRTRPPARLARGGRDGGAVLGT